MNHTDFDNHTGSVAKKRFRSAVSAGYAVILLAVVMSFFYPQSLQNMPAGFTSPILALEFAESLTDVRKLLGEDSELIRRVHIGHYLDMAFLLAYGAFLALANIGVWYHRGRFISVVGAIAAVAASAADFAENLLLMQLTDALLHLAAAPNFLLLQFFVSFKFLAIALSMGCLVPILWQQSLAAKLYGAATAITAITTLLTVAGYHSASTAMMIATVIAWVALWISLIRLKRTL